MAGPLDIDIGDDIDDDIDDDIEDDMQRLVLRKGETTAKGGHVFQRPLQRAETGQISAQRPGPARRAVHRRDLQRRGFPLRSVRVARGRALRSATTCCCASTRCAGASRTCTAWCPTATGGEFGKGRAVIDQWSLMWPEAQ